MIRTAILLGLHNPLALSEQTVQGARLARRPAAGPPGGGGGGSSTKFAHATGGHGWTGSFWSPKLFKLGRHKAPPAQALADVVQQERGSRKVLPWVRWKWQVGALARFCCG